MTALPPNTWTHLSNHRSVLHNTLAEPAITPFNLLKLATAIALCNNHLIDRSNIFLDSFLSYLAHYILLLAMVIEVIDLIELVSRSSAAREVAARCIVYIAEDVLGYSLSNLLWPA
jgi:hypothetical protein